MYYELRRRWNVCILAVSFWLEEIVRLGIVVEME